MGILDWLFYRKERTETQSIGGYVWPKGTRPVVFVSPIMWQGTCYLQVRTEKVWDGKIWYPLGVKK